MERVVEMDQKRCYQRCVGLLLFIGLLFFFFSEVQARDDWEYWGEYSFKYKITDKASLKIAPKMKARDDFSNPYFWESAQGMSYKLSKNFDIGVYHLAAKEDRAGKDKTESRFRGEFNLHALFKGMKLSNRHRYEYRTFNIGESKDRYRNRIQLTFSPIDVLGHTLIPYISNEFFYDLEESEYNKNRALLGFSKKLSKKMKVGIYYMAESNRRGSDWDEKHIVGTKLDFNLN